MSESFTDPLELDIIDGSWATSRPLRYDIGFKGSDWTIEVPTGFKTDLATVPRPLWSILPRDDPRYAPAAVLHDYLCTRTGFSRFLADAIFLEAMTVLGVGRIRRFIMYAGVRIYAILAGKH